MFSEITARLAVAGVYDKLPTGWQTLDVRGMIDGPGNSATLVDKYIDQGLRILKQPDSKLLVICDYGQSRSNFIAARVLALYEGVSLDEAIAAMKSTHADSKIKPSLLHGDSSMNTGAHISRIAVSGGRGFVGRRLCSDLANSGAECLALTRDAHGDYLRSSDSLTEVLASFDPDLFIHLAHPKPYNSESTFQSAFAQLIAVANYCEDYDVRLVYPSGWVVFDGLTDNEVSSTSKVSPHSQYGRLKAVSETYLLEAAKHSLDVRILRLPGLFGNDSLEPRFLRYFADCVRNGDEIVYHEFENGSACVPLVHVDICVSGFVDAIKDFHSLPLISHVGTDERAPSVRDIACRLSESTGVIVSGTPVTRTTFNGHFVPDIKVSDDSSMAARIDDFILDLCGVPHDEQ